MTDHRPEQTPIWEHRGQCHCGALRLKIQTHRAPAEQVLGACQCSFCRKHNVRAFSDPKAHVELEVADPTCLQRYAFGLRTSEQVICNRCGVYMAMVLSDAGQHWSVVNVDTLNDRDAFTRLPEPRVYDAEDAPARIARRKSRWCPTKLIGWPDPVSA